MGAPRRTAVLIGHDGGVSDALDHPRFRITPDRRRLSTSDGVRLDSVLVRSAVPRTTAVVLANGFTGTWRNPHTRMIARGLLPLGDVMTFDFRGHHGSGGACTVGDAEIHDVEAVVGHLRGLGYTSIATVGFSMGAAVVLRHAGLLGGVSAVVAVSGPSRWYYRGTRRMRLLHLGIEHPLGRRFLRTFRKVTLIGEPWDPVPADPREAAARITPAPLLVVHGDADAYFPVAHARAIYEAAEDPRELWIEPGMGHAERAMTPELVDRVAAWLRNTGLSGSPGPG